MRFLTVVSVFIASSTMAFAAEVCEPVNWNGNFGDTVQIQKKVKVNAICAIGTRTGSYTLTGVDIVNAPKGTFQMLEQAPEIKFKVSKAGRHTVILRQNYSDRYGKNQFIDFVVTLIAVPDAW